MAKETQSPRENPNPQHRHEESDTEFKPILVFVLGLAVLILISMLAMSGLFDYFKARQAELQQQPSPLFDTRQLPPEPRLQATPAVDLKQLREREEELLSSYRWVDKESRIFRIPVERAMEIIAERGLPHRRGLGAEGQRGEP